MTLYYPDLCGASDWLKQLLHATRPIRSTTTQIWVVTRHQYGISALLSQSSFGGETSGSAAKCRLFSQARVLLQDKEINCKSHGRRSCLLSTLDLLKKKEIRISYNIKRKKSRSPKTITQLITTCSENVSNYIFRQARPAFFRFTKC